VAGELCKISKLYLHGFWLQMAWAQLNPHQSARLVLESPERLRATDKLSTNHVTIIAAYGHRFINSRHLHQFIECYSVVHGSVYIARSLKAMLDDY